VHQLARLIGLVLWERELDQHLQMWHAASRRLAAVPSGRSMITR
jgi:hypothetical protein